MKAANRATAPISVTSKNFIDQLERIGLSQSAAARVLGCSDRTVRRYVAGRRVPGSVLLALQQMPSESGEPAPPPTKRPPPEVAAAHVAVLASRTPTLVGRSTTTDRLAAVASAMRGPRGRR
jgi:transposase